MANKRFNVTLDEDHAERLSHMALHAHVPEGTIARSLLSIAIDQANPSGEHMTRILEGIPGFAEDMALAEQQIQRGETIPLDAL